MLKRIVLGLFVVMLPGVAKAQTPENYLPAKSQLYFRWDGMKTHRAAFDKTALGLTMKGDTGRFLDELGKYFEEVVQNAAGVGDPRIAPFLKDAGKLISTMHNNGLVLGIEVEQINPPKAQAVIVFPNAAGSTGSVMPLIQRIVEETQVKAKSTKVGKRFVGHLALAGTVKKFKDGGIESEDSLAVGWWDEGPDAVVFIGTGSPVAYAKAIDAKKTGIAKHPLYEKIVGFKEFPTAARGYIDVKDALGVVADFAPPAAAVIHELGLKGLKSVTFASGFDGLVERSVVDVETVGTRKGLLGLASQKKISMKDLPVLPNDITGFSAGSVNLNKSFEIVMNTVDGLIRVFNADKADDIKEQIKAFEGAVGVDIHKELFGSFGDVMVSYSSPSDGILGTGALVAIQVKDGKKLHATLEKLAKAIPANPGGELVLNKKAYHGGEIMQVMLVGKTNSHVATVGVYKDWFIYSNFPQPIKGFILRQEGELPAWKADAALTKALAPFPKEFTAIQVSDPRPAVQTVLTATPLVMNLVNTFGGLGAQFGVLPNFRPFDLDLIPHAQEATRHLFPNVTVSTDDGKRIRSETRASLALPF
jgi:hypothetical protein